MNNIFERFAPRWRQAVSIFANKIWVGDDDEKSEEEFEQKAVLFSRAYRHAMEAHYRAKRMDVYRGTLDGWVFEWIKKQNALKDTLKVIVQDKQDKLVKKEIELLKSTQDPQAMIDRLYKAKENETVYKVFSFKDNFKNLSEQYGEESAYDLGTGINERIIQNFSDKYFWNTQHDKKVRDTHRQLYKKIFLFADPPTTVDKYGKRHTGNPGSDYGCRCWADVAPEREKALRGYIVYER
jgi:hypothetical protein